MNSDAAHAVMLQIRMALLFSKEPRPIRLGLLEDNSVASIEIRDRQFVYNRHYVWQNRPRELSRVKGLAEHPLAKQIVALFDASMDQFPEGFFDEESETEDETGI